MNDGWTIAGTVRSGVGEIVYGWTVGVGEWPRSSGVAVGCAGSEKVRI